jgi:adenosylcobinamide-GDP ribazoletransferase
MKSLLASIAFCTRIPVRIPFTAEDIGKAARWFPLIGIMLGGIYLGIARLLEGAFPASLIAVMILAFEALLTGALHLDGVADTLDGFGGGKNRDDILRIMRDPTIGTYGALALILLVGLKVTVIAALIEQHRYFPLALMAPALGRWNIIVLSRWLPYARSSPSVSQLMGPWELIVATLTIVLAIASTNLPLGAMCWGACGVSTVLFGLMCRRKIGGITGDTLGASEQLGEITVLLVGLALR